MSCIDVSVCVDIGRERELFVPRFFLFCPFGIQCAVFGGRGFFFNGFTIFLCQCLVFGGGVKRGRGWRCGRFDMERCEYGWIGSARVRLDLLLLFFELAICGVLLRNCWIYLCWFILCLYIWISMDD